MIYKKDRYSKIFKDIFDESIEKYYNETAEKIVSSKLKEYNIKKVDDMLQFFKENKLNLSEKLNSNKKTAMQLEIDQVGSGPTLVALLTRNRALAEKCNLFGGEFKCIYTYLLEESVSFFMSKNNFDLNISGVEETKAYQITNREQESSKVCFNVFLLQ